MVSDEPTFRTDGGVPTGTAILADERGRSLEWHHSIEFDGFVHKTACDRVIDTDDVRDALVELPEAWNREVARADGCSTCSRSISDLEDDVATDGGHSAGEMDHKDAVSLAQQLAEDITIADWGAASEALDQLGEFVAAQDGGSNG